MVLTGEVSARPPRRLVRRRRGASLAGRRRSPSRRRPTRVAGAHIEPLVAARDLESLGAVVFAATRSRAEFEAVRTRRDLVTIWGVGCHPGVPDAHRDFDPSQFSALMDETALVSEIGLDGRSPTTQVCWTGSAQPRARALIETARQSLQQRESRW